MNVVKKYIEVNLLKSIEENNDIIVNGETLVVLKNSNFDKIVDFISENAKDEKFIFSNFENSDNIVEYLTMWFEHWNLDFDISFNQYPFNTDSGKQMFIIHLIYNKETKPLDIDRISDAIYNVLMDKEIQLQLNTNHGKTINMQLNRLIWHLQNETVYV